MRLTSIGEGGATGWGEEGSWGAGTGGGGGWGGVELEADPDVVDDVWWEAGVANKAELLGGGAMGFTNRSCEVRVPCLWN